jgi:hypothetical protein
MSVATKNKKLKVYFRCEKQWYHISKKYTKSIVEEHGPPTKANVGS